MPLPPQFLENGRASTMMAALDQAAPSFSTQSLAEMAERVPYVFVSQLPDAAKANKRLLAHVHEQLRPIANLFESPLDSCMVHQEHRTPARQ